MGDLTSDFGSRFGFADCGAFAVPDWLTSATLSLSKTPPQRRRGSSSSNRNMSSNIERGSRTYRWQYSSWWRGQLHDNHIW